MYFTHEAINVYIIETKLSVLCAGSHKFICILHTYFISSFLNGVYSDSNPTFKTITCTITCCRFSIYMNGNHHTPSGYPEKKTQYS